MTGPVRIHHVAKYQKWEDIFSDIVAQIGIKKVTKYLTKLKTVPQDILLKYISIYISKENNLINIKNVLSSFEAKQIFEALYELINHEESPELHLSFLTAFREYFVPSIIYNQNMITNIVDKLSLVHFENIVIERLSSDENKKRFLQKLYDNIGNREYLMPVPIKCIELLNEEKQEKGDVSDTVNYINHTIQKAIDESVPASETTLDLIKNYLRNNADYHTIVNMFSDLLHMKYDNDCS